MATTTQTRDLEAPQQAAPALLVVLPPLASSPQNGFDELIANVHEALAGIPAVLATPDSGVNEWQDGDLRLISYAPQAASSSSWILTAADFLDAHELAAAHHATSLLLLGPESHSLKPQGLRALADQVLSGSCDLVVPRYAIPARSALVTAAILYPVSRALFGVTPRFPLAVDFGMSARMAARLATTAQRFTAANQPDALLWPLTEAAVANLPIAEIEVGPRLIPQPPSMDLTSLLTQVLGSFFTEVEARAAFWQRARVASPAAPRSDTVSSPPATDDVQSMLESFRLGYGNLVEIWSLILPPQSLVGLKRLSLTAAESFNLPDALWARIVYDFLLAYRLRTINRGHLLGAMTPIYLAWVASFILRCNNGADPEDLVESLTTSFSTEKPYLVSRWRWPDRFNP